MFTGVDIDQAIKYWKKGKEVIVIDRTIRSQSGGYETYSLESLFQNLELLADVPAVERPEFNQEVMGMIQNSVSDREGKGKTNPPSEAGVGDGSGQKEEKW